MTEMHTSGDRDAAASGAGQAAARRLVPRGGSPGVDRLAQLAARLLDAEAAQVSLLADVQVVAGAAGRASPGGTEAPLESSLCTVTAATGGPLVVGDAPADERVAALPPVATGAVGAYLGIPLRTGDGDIVGALCVFDGDRREWTPADVTLLEQLAGPVIVELELAALAEEYAANQARWDLAIEAAGVGGFDWNVASGTLSLDDRLMKLLGYDPSTFDGSIEAFSARVHPDDRSGVEQAITDAVAGCTTYADEYRIVLPDGTQRWVQSRGRALCNEDGVAVRLVGAAYDTTEAREAEGRVARILESMTAAFFSVDRLWRFTYVNSEAERVLGRSRDDLVGRELWQLYPAAVGSAFERHYRETAETGRPTSFEAYYPAPLDGWYEVRAWPSPDGLSVYFIDITQRRAAQDRVALFGEVTQALAETLDASEAVARLARLLVPAVADWCIVSLVDGEHPDWQRGFRDVAWHHRDEAMQPVLDEYAGCRATALGARSIPGEVLRRREPLVLSDAAEAMAGTLTSPDAQELIRRLAPASEVVQPVMARGRILGLLTLCWDRAKVPDAATVDTIGEIAARAGLALDNVRLYEQQRHLAEGFQRSLLTEPPEPDHLEVVVRYEPAAEAAQVGGDWYDAFLQRHGATMLVIGDVVGHDAQAAAAMGQVRGLLRGIAASTGDGPARVLAHLDETMELLQVTTTATCLIARFEQTDEERVAGLTRMRWSNAGHPPPILIDEAGGVSVLVDADDGGADLLLGIDPASRRREHEVTLRRGSTVLLYTDGLVERRGQALDEGLGTLGQCLTALTDRPLEALCDEVLVRMLPPHREDDVALAAVRLHREDQPRPAEAGPNRVPRPIEDEERSGPAEA